MDTFLKKFQTKGGEHTHTKIGDTKLNVFGGCYSIPLENMNEFYELVEDINNIDIQINNY